MWARWGLEGLGTWSAPSASRPMPHAPTALSPQAHWYQLRQLLAENARQPDDALDDADVGNEISQLIDDVRGVTAAQGVERSQHLGSHGSDGSATHGQDAMTWRRQCQICRAVGSASQDGDD